MKLAQLRAFVSVAEQGSIGAAARALNFSQPAVTKHIRALETELGVALIHRSSRGAELTPLGRSFLSRARSACQELDRGREELAEATKGESGRVVLSASPAAAAELLPGALNALRRVNPAVDIRVIEGMPVSSLSRVRDGSLDFALGPKMLEPLTGDLVATPLYRNKMTIVVRRGHPLASTRSLAALVEYEWMTAGFGRNRSNVDEMFQGAGLPSPRWVIRCESIPGLIAIVAKSDLIATIPKSILTLGIAGGLLDTVHIREQPATSMVCLFVKRESAPTPTAARLIRLIKDEAKRVRSQQ